MRKITQTKRVLFICPYPEDKAPSQRFRFEQYLGLLDINYEQASFWTEKEWPRIYEEGRTKFKAGLLLWKVLSTMRAFSRRVLLLFRIRRFDKVFIHREATPLGPPWFEWLVAKVFHKPIIFDFDDAIWLPNNSEANKKLIGKLKYHGKTAKICNWAKTVVVGNEFLAEYARQFCEDVHIIPTTVDTENYHNPDLYREKSSEPACPEDRYRVVRSETRNEEYNVQGTRPARPAGGYKESDDKAYGLRLEASSLPTIGWTGTHSTLKQLVPLFPTLKEVHKIYPFRFLLIADQTPEEFPEFVEFRKWQKETEIEDLMQMDIGLMPLFDNDWERGKCGFKAIQYLALKVPAIVSEVGVNSQIVQHGFSGFICHPMSSNDKVYSDWSKSLLNLLNDMERREKLGLQGRKRIVNEYSIEAQVNRYSALF